ncbi:hypothetical protein MKW92_030408 [Papaver armeniacum]|nr:hypothetical protein MKW92_030408 [Papaver armeniacum]
MKLKMRMLETVTAKLRTDSNLDFLEIQNFRFYFKCLSFSAELTMKTDPQNSDYVEADKDQKKRDHEEIGDAMKPLENRTLDPKREMDILAALDEMKSM